MNRVSSTVLPGQLPWRIVGEIGFRQVRLGALVLKLPVLSRAPATLPGRSLFKGEDSAGQG